MALFDKLKGSKPVELTPKSALALSAIALIASDGVIEEAELFELSKIVRGDHEAVNTALQILRSIPIANTTDMVAKILNEKQKLAVIAILTDLAMADGRLAADEQKILQQYVEKFGISEATLKPIIDVIALKNDLSVFS
ncbi:MAG: TerB family tellurite resistance protein [Methanomicrobiales archaeon]|nr:TerB family tellurite resistance protein [Methanomicrobiales archaeon]